MTPEQITTIVVGVLQSGGILFVAWCWIRGLKARLSGLQGTIDALKGTIDAQEQTLKVMEKMVDIYRNLLNNLPEDLDNYKSLISRTKDDVITAQQQAIKNKDDELEARAETKLKALDVQEKMLAEVLETFAQFQALAGDLQSRLASVNFVGYSPIHALGTVVSNVVFNPRNDLLLEWSPDMKPEPINLPGEEPTISISNVPKVSPES
jgi:tetrahydromethanopterin S-methyltransferase subunit B